MQKMVEQICEMLVFNFFLVNFLKF